MGGQRERSALQQHAWSGRRWALPRMRITSNPVQEHLVHHPGPGCPCDCNARSRGQMAQQSMGTATQLALCPRCVQHPVDKRGDKRRKPRQLRPLTECLKNGQSEGLAEASNRSPLPAHGDTLKGHRKRGQSEATRCRVALARRWDGSRGPTRISPVARKAVSPSREALHSPRRDRPGFLRDKAQGANSSVSLDGSPEFAGKRIPRKTKVRNGSAQNGQLTPLEVSVCPPVHDAPGWHAGHPVLDTNAHDGGEAAIS